MGDHFAKILGVTLNIIGRRRGMPLPKAAVWCCQGHIGCDLGHGEAAILECPGEGVDPQVGMWRKRGVAWRV